MIGYDKGFEEASESALNIDRFSVPCNICGKPMKFSSEEGNWESEVKPALYKAFKNWYHTRCATNR